MLPTFFFIIMCLAALIAMAFYTLLERKILAYSQLRKGPNKVSFAGLLQPIADALKLFTKENISPHTSNKVTFAFAPPLGLSLALFMWHLYPMSYPTYFYSYGVILILCLSSLGVYVTLLAGWTSNSKYALLGALRAVAQTISYEISLALLLILLVIPCNSFDMNSILSFSSSPLIFLFFPLALIWLTSILAELHRTPFDFAEGESELVSGFNVEYSASKFALLFMSEYINILTMSVLTALLLCSPTPVPILLLPVIAFVISAVCIFIRASYPRMRYDKLMQLTWKTFLPLSLGLTPVMILLSSFLSS